MPIAFRAGCSGPRPAECRLEQRLEARRRPIRPRGRPTRSVASADDWLVYKHWDSGRGGYGPMTDFHGYNGSEPRELNEIKDVGMEARVTLSESIEALSVALRSGFDRFVLRIPTAQPRRDRAAAKRACRADRESL